MSFELIQHPVAKHGITQLRRKETSHPSFRRYCEQVTTILAIEATRDLRETEVPVTTPLEDLKAPVVGEGVVVVAILRAGAGMVDSVVRLLPDVSVGYIGLERDEATAEARRYYCKLPPLGDKRVLIVDPMLATGGSSEQAVEAVYEAGARRVDFLCIVAAPEGVERLEARFPELRIFCGALDRELDANKFIRPGLGDFGDRLYGT